MSAGETIDTLLVEACPVFKYLKQVGLHAAGGVAIREFLLKDGFGNADYLLYVDSKAAGVIEAKKRSATLTGLEHQSGTLFPGPRDSLPASRRPLAFIYESTGVATYFAEGLCVDLHLPCRVVSSNVGQARLGA